MVDRDSSELLTSLLYQQLHSADTVRYRQAIFRDLEDGGLHERMKYFAEQLRQVRAHLGQLKKMQIKYQREGWFLDAVTLYCEAVHALAEALRASPVQSPALLGFRDFLADYLASAPFTSLVADTEGCKQALAQIRYCIRIRGLRVEVSRYDGQADYSAEVEKTFERFQQGTAKDYRVTYRTWPGMNHVGGQILQLVARLFDDEFSALDEFCSGHTNFFDETVQRFERELQFYLAYFDYITPIRSAGLSFCYPEITSESKEVFATNTFDLALAHKLISENAPVVQNEFHLTGPERILVVSGPNQGAKRRSLGPSASSTTSPVWAAPSLAVRHVCPSSTGFSPTSRRRRISPR